MTGRTLKCSVCGRFIEESEAQDENLKEIECSEIFPSLECEGVFEVTG